MDFFSSLNIYVVLIGVILFVFTVTQLVTVMHLRKKIIKIENSFLKYKSDVSSEIHAASQGAIGVGKRLLRVEKLLRQQESTPKLLDSIREELSGFELADSLILKGESSARVVEQSGISLAEAQLLKLLNQSDDDRQLN